MKREIVDFLTCPTRIVVRCSGYSVHDFVSHHEIAIGYDY
jgi:hypothetical protein